MVCCVICCVCFVLCVCVCVCVFCRVFLFLVLIKPRYGPIPELKISSSSSSYVAAAAAQQLVRSAIDRLHSHLSFQQYSVHTRRCQREGIFAKKNHTVILFMLVCVCVCVLKFVTHAAYTAFFFGSIIQVKSTPPCPPSSTQPLQLGGLFNSLARFSVGYIIAFIYSWRLSLIVLAYLPISITSQAMVGKVIGVHAARQQSFYAQAGAVAHEVLTLIKTVWTFGTFEREEKRYREQLLASRKSGVRGGVVKAFAIALPNSK